MIAVIILNTERGWFPRAVPLAGGLRAAHCPGLAGKRIYGSLEADNDAETINNAKCLSDEFNSIGK